MIVHTALLVMLTHAAVADAPRAVAAVASAPVELDFDLLGEAKPPPPDSGSFKARRTMLQLHQGTGLALTAAMLATVILGQVNYNDRFLGDSTARFELAHAISAYTTFGLFVGTGALAILAPRPEPFDGIAADQMLLHRIAMFSATAGMVAQIVLGILTRQLEGFVAQRDLAVTHLAVGWVTFGLVAVGVGAIVF